MNLKIRCCSSIRSVLGIRFFVVVSGIPLKIKMVCWNCERGILPMDIKVSTV